MATLQQTRVPVQRTARERVLRDRPYHPWRYLPLAAYLCEREYSDGMRNRIVDFIADGGFLESLVVVGALEPEDLDGAKEALAEGRAWHAARAARAAAEHDGAPEPDAPDGAITRAPGYREALERDGVTLTPDGEPYEPTEEDREDYRRYLDEQDRLEAMREWYRTRPPFAEWLESQGGPA